MEPLFAYIDPGSGSLVVQAVIAGLVAVPIFFRRQISRVFRAVRPSDEAETGSPRGTDDGSPGA